MSSYSIADVSAVLGISKRGAEIRAAREAWAYEEETVRGGRRRIYRAENLPREVQAALLQHQTKQLQAPAVVTQPASRALVVTARREDLTDEQRAKEDARIGILHALSRLQNSAGCSQEAAMTTLLTQAKAGELDPVLDRMLRLARDPRGRAGDGSGLPSVRSLKRWLKDARPAPKRSAPVPQWAAAFLAHYQLPQKPTVEDAYREAVKAGAFSAEVPSIHQVRRFLGRLGKVTRESGRMLDRELKNIKPFVRRSFEHLEPNDVWTGDGHTFDAEVQHPLHGRPFRPEITTFLDVATRRAMAWSVGLAESSWAVADALRWGVERHGIPALIYVDNGSGYKNAFMSDEATGLAGRLGSTITNSIPYNSQARGVIERSHKTIWVAGAQLLPSYMGAVMDRQARLEQFKLTRRALKHGGAMPLMPWDVFIQFCQDRIDDYNAKAHRALKGLSPDMALRGFQARGWEPTAVASEELDTLFRPRTTRTVARGELLLMNNRYFSRELAEFHGMEVHVAYDIHDPQRVWVYLPDGRFLGTAECNGNSKHYFPVPVVEQAREKRAKGRLARVDVKREEILAELHGAPALTVEPASTVVIGGRVINPMQAIAQQAAALAEAKQTVEALPPSVTRITPAPEAPRRRRSEMTAEEVFAEWSAVGEKLRAGIDVSDTDRRFHELWPGSSQGRMYFKRQGNGV